MLYALIALCGILSFIATRSSYYPLKWAAGFGWWAFFVYWLTSDAVTRGTPTDIIVSLLLVFLGLLFLLWGMAGRKGSVDVEEQYSSTGELIGRIMKGSTNREPKRSNSLTNSSNLEYRQTVRKAARGSGKPRRRR